MPPFISNTLRNTEKLYIDEIMSLLWLNFSLTFDFNTVFLCSELLSDTLTYNWNSCCNV